MGGIWNPDLILEEAYGYPEILEVMVNDIGTVSLICVREDESLASDFVVAHKDIPSLIKVLEEAYAK